MKKRNFTQRAPRQDYTASALIYAGNQQLTCRIINIASSGVLVYATEEVKQGSFIRINLTLPGMEQVLDVDGVVARVGRREEHVILGIKFYEPTAEFTEVLATFVAWLERQRTGKGKGKGKGKRPPLRKPAPPRPARGPKKPPPREHPVVPTSEAEQSLSQRTTGPHFPRVPTSELRRVSAPVAATIEEQIRLKEEVEARWHQREKQSQVRSELRDIYRDALTELARGSTTAGKGKKK